MTPRVPSYDEMLWPTLQAVRSVGGSATIQELDDEVVRLAGWGEDIQSVPHGDGPKSEVEYRLAWARSYLKKMGLLTTTGRGVWSVTKEGQSVSESEIAPLHAQVKRELARQRSQQKTSSAPSFEEQVDKEAEEPEWKDTLLDMLLQMSPSGFEHLAKRLLREAGFTATAVTGKSSDGGIDGTGVYQLSLLSFPVYFQCKRYRGTVGSSVVRDFRGAMAGRGDKGLLITTGKFTADARAESKRDGTPPIDLIDGEKLCDLLKHFSLGVTTKTRVVEDVEVDRAFFETVEPQR